jgi:hypothetical protein
LVVQITHEIVVGVLVVVVVVVVVIVVVALREPVAIKSMVF